MNIYESYKKVAAAFGPSGRETKAVEVAKEMVMPYADEVSVDVMGNLIARKKGTGKKIMVSAHIDSIGLVATYIDEKGFVRFGSVGGLSRIDLVSQMVVFENGTKGVVYYDENVKVSEITISSMYVDIGAKNREEAEKCVSVGDFAVFETLSFAQNDIIAGNYMDNRISCVVLIEAMKLMEKTNNDVYFVFSVQEEVGLRGAFAASYNISPEIGIAVDVTDTGDVPEKKDKMAVDLGKGTAIKYMDSSVICSPVVTKALETAAIEANIPYQKEVLRFGGTDTAAMQRAKGGAVVGAISIPTRYIHSASEMVSVSDVENSVKLLAKALVMEW